MSRSREGRTNEEADDPCLQKGEVWWEDGEAGHCRGVGVDFRNPRKSTRLQAGDKIKRWPRDDGRSTVVGELFGVRLQDVQ